MRRGHIRHGRGDRRGARRREDPAPRIVRQPGRHGNERRREQPARDAAPLEGHEGRRRDRGHGPGDQGSPDRHGSGRWEKRRHGGRAVRSRDVPPVDGPDVPGGRCRAALPDVRRRPDQGRRRRARRHLGQQVRQGRRPGEGRHRCHRRCRRGRGCRRRGDARPHRRSADADHAVLPPRGDHARPREPVHRRPDGQPDGPAAKGSAGGTAPVRAEGRELRLLPAPVGHGTPGKDPPGHGPHQHGHGVRLRRH